MQYTFVEQTWGNARIMVFILIKAFFVKIKNKLSEGGALQSNISLDFNQLAIGWLSTTKEGLALLFWDTLGSSNKPMIPCPLSSQSHVPDMFIGGPPMHYWLSFNDTCGNKAPYTWANPSKICVPPFIS